MMAPEQQQQQESEIPMMTDDQPEDAVDELMQLKEDIEEYISVVQNVHNTITKQVLEEEITNDIHRILNNWNRFLQSEQGGQVTSSIASSDIVNDIKKFFHSYNISSEDRTWFQKWLLEWNEFLLAQQGESPVSKCGAILTVLCVLCYLVDMVSDIGTAVYFGYTGQWWQCALTLLVVYLAVASSAAFKWLVGEIQCTGPLDALRYFGSLFVNWPDLQVCWSLLYVEWKLLSGSPSSNAHLIVDWRKRRVRMAWLKYTEGLYEACPQAILQLVLLLPELNGDIPWSVSIRIASTAISVCMAGAALVNKQKSLEFPEHIVLLPRELFMLYVWMVPMIVSRLLSLALLLSVHLYGALVYMVLHFILYSVYWCSIEGSLHTCRQVFQMCLYILLFLISPFDDSDPHPSCVLRFTLHFLGNIGMTVWWALSTHLAYTQPVLYVAIITSNIVMFVIGLLGCVLHWKYWRYGVQENN